MKPPVKYTIMQTPVGDIRVAWCERGVVEVSTGKQLRVRPPASWKHDANLECPATEQLQEYFDGTRQEFDLPLVLEGTEFQKRVWRALAKIPYGATISYGELARRIGRPDAARAVGAANGRNPISIVLPCHRVIGQSGKLTGYGGGLAVKEALLALERGVLEQLSMGLGR